MCVCECPWDRVFPLKSVSPVDAASFAWWSSWVCWRLGQFNYGKAKLPPSILSTNHAPVNPNFTAGLWFVFCCFALIALNDNRQSRLWENSSTAITHLNTLCLLFSHFIYALFLAAIFSVWIIRVYQKSRWFWLRSVTNRSGFCPKCVWVLAQVWHTLGRSAAIWLVSALQNNKSDVMLTVSLESLWISPCFLNKRSGITIV